MGRRSLQVQTQYIKEVNNAFVSLGLTQAEFAEARLQLSRSTVSNFLRGKPVSKENFVRICQVLKLDWELITGLKTSSVGNANPTKSAENKDNLDNIAGNLIQQTQSDPQTPASSPVDINTLVTQLRQQVKADIETRCGTMRIFDMTQPIGLGKIYTQVNILEKISGSRRKEIRELFGNCTLEDFERFNLGRVTEEKIEGKEAVTKYNQLFILGKPGAGKTTFLKHLAIQCSQGEFQGDLVPFFVTLKDFAETEAKSDLLSFLNNYIKSDNAHNLQQILNHHKALILLDGLDEVLEADSKRVIKEIETLSNKYPGNQYVLTCRIAAKEYTFEKFTEVEIADFDWQQITTFAHNWFKHKPVKPETFLTRLEKDEPIKELVSNPLLLTLLCISFEELGDFPSNRKELYEEGLDALLKKWDAKRGIQRDKIYKPLSIAKKEDLLSNIAWKTFEPGDYFFKVDRAKRYISEYIRNLPGANLDDEALQGDSGIVLKNIEAQHGLLVARAKNIYSFSHLTFQEYFTAREIILVRQSRYKALQELVSHLFDKRWREVFLLAVAMSPNAERLVLLMKNKIDYLMAKDDRLQQFLDWLHKKTNIINIQIKKEILRFFYFDLFYTDEFGIDYFSSNKEKNLLNIEDYKIYDILEIDFCLSNALSYANYIVDSSLNKHLYPYPSVYWHDLVFLGTYETVDYYLKNAINRSKNQINLRQTLKSLYQQLPELTESGHPSDIHSEWWEYNGIGWTIELRAIMIKYRNIGHNWKFSQSQKTLLEQYYFANQLLTQCLHQDCYVSPEVRQEIEETLLLPIAEIEKRKSL